MKAYVAIRDQPHYRRDAFISGLSRAGYAVQSGLTTTPEPGDVLVTWNLYGYHYQLAAQYEARGAKVIVAENGYAGRVNGHQLYALALSGHNGSGTWNVGGPERFKALGIELKPWQTGEKIVIRGQRGIGSPSMASPPNWHNEMKAQLAQVTRRPIQAFEHPGNHAERDLAHETYLQGAHALVIWGSSVGVKALTMGVPVFYAAPNWICEGAAIAGIDALESPKRDDATRRTAMERMSWAQWSIAEIESGEPFARLLES